MKDKQDSLLILAAMADNKEFFINLIKQGKSIFKRNREGDTALDIIVCNGHLDLLILCMQLFPNCRNYRNLDDFNLLHLAAYFDQPEIMCWLLDHASFDIEDKTEQGHHVLSIALESKCKSILKVLLHRGIITSELLDNKPILNPHAFMLYNQSKPSFEIGSETGISACKRP